MSNKVTISYDAYTGDLELVHDTIETLSEYGIEFTLRFDKDSEDRPYNLYGNGESLDVCEVIDKALGNPKWVKDRY